MLILLALAVIIFYLEHERDREDEARIRAAYRQTEEPKAMSGPPSNEPSA